MHFTVLLFNGGLPVIIFYIIEIITSKNVRVKGCGALKVGGGKGVGWGILTAFGRRKHSKP